MRVLTEIKSQPAEWVTKDIPVSVYRSALQTYLESTVVIVSENMIQDVKNCLLDDEAPIAQQVRTIFREFLLKASLRVVPAVDSGDVALESSADCRFVTLPGSSDFLDALKERTRPLIPGTERDSFYNSCVKPLARTATSAVIVDRFLLDQLSRRGEQSGAYWFLRMLILSGLPSIQIFSEPQDDFNESRVRELLDMLTDNTSSVSGGVDIQICACYPLGGQRFPHDRHVRFSYGQQRRSVSIDMGDGTSLFGKSQVGQAYTFADIPEQTARSREELLSSARFRSRRIAKAS